ncbi:hypothetical protein RRF57_012915 [Xylaria bambusicola]|uniref:Uncharacterized protein n=1 Tax=Xylaria bambusicola TaxID=326684 RepID=A0AAN7V069_9PEZI
MACTDAIHVPHTATRAARSDVDSNRQQPQTGRKRTCISRLRPQTPTSTSGCEASAASKTLPLQLSPLAPDVLAPVIRDFDELESVAEEKLYEKMI